MDAAGVVKLAARAVVEKKGLDPVILDLKGITLIADYFIITSGSSSIQVQAIADRVREVLNECGMKPLNRDGWEDVHWLLLDYGDVVIHIFQEEERNYYDLERLWGDARVIPVEDFI